VDAIEKTKDILFNNNYLSFDKVYYSSNEDLDSLFHTFFVEDKKVLTVLASSDQLFHLYQKSPKSVDTFDINGLTKYYYYLRKWSILYCDEYYPDVFTHKNIMKIISKVKPNDSEEQEVLDYWLQYICTFYSYMTRDLFYKNGGVYKNQISCLEKLKEELLQQKFHFEQFDISKEQVKEKYDKIVVSNILEYYYFKHNEMQQIRDHLYDMLEDDGEVLVSYYTCSRPSPAERDFFREEFDYRMILGKRDDFIGCVYRKRMSTKNS
jgi:hypothetical protein